MDDSAEVKFSSALVFRLAGIKSRIGFAGDKRSLLLSRAIKEPREKMHRSKKYLYLLEQLTGKSLASRPPRVYLAQDDLTRARDTLEEYSIAINDRFVAIAPRAVAESRRWGSTNYGRLAAQMAKDVDCKIVLIGSAADQEAGEAVRLFDESHIINLCGKTDLMTAAAILSYSNLFVGNDSGLAHLAGAVHCPVVVLSGPDDPEETSPICDLKKVIIKDIDCIKCVKNVCPKSGDDFMRCMKLITVDEVAVAAREIIKD